MLLSYESSGLPHRLVQQRYGQLGAFSLTKQLNVMAEDAAVSYHTTISRVQLIAYLKMFTAFE